MAVKSRSKLKKREPVKKRPGPADDTSDGPDQPNCLYRGTQAVDGVGLMLVTEVGDATMSILESINLPPLSLPIFQSDRALVDGGLLNNIPANVLVAKGCNFVIASSVTAKLTTVPTGTAGAAWRHRGVAGPRPLTGSCS